MIDLKDWSTPKELELNLGDCTSCVDVIRFAVNPKKLSKIKKYLEITKTRFYGGSQFNVRSFSS